MMKQRSAISYQRSAIIRKLFTIHYSLFTNKKGFTLVELMITMVVFVLVIAAASQVFTGLLTQFKQQSKIAETNIEGIIGLEIMRQDIDSAGYGLPWVIPAAVAYDEATAAEADDYNDCNGTAPCNPPRAIVSGNNMNYASPNNPFDGSDYLVIKAVNVATNAAAQRWTTLRTGNVKRTWGTTADDFADTDRVIVLSPGTSDAARQSLVLGGGAWSNTYANTASFAPPDAVETFFVYGVDPDTNLRMPFNRADYYILKFDTSGNDIVPARCAPNTGILRKAIVNQGAGTFAGGTLPLLDCVADMQVVFALDNNQDGVFESGVGGDAYSNVLTGLTAEQLRRRVKEVRVYVLAHEGQRDPNFTYNNPPTTTANPIITVGEFGLGRNFNLAGITDWQNYRWKVYTLVVKPNNLR